MATTINADTSTGGAIVTGDASGVLGLQAAGSTQVTISTSGVVLANPLPVASGGTGGSATPTAGGIVYGTGTAQAVTTAGSSGQLLQSNGASAPTWAAAPAGGSWIYLSTVTASGASTMDIETTFDSTYDVYKIIVSNLTQSLSSNIIAARFKMGGTYATGSNAYSYYLSEIAGPTFLGAGATGNFAYLFGYSTAIGNGTGGNATIELTLYKPSSTTLYKTMQFIGTYFGTGGGAPYPISTLGNITYAGNYTDACTGIRLYGYSGGLLTGTARVYGLKNS